jgi:hypothetical protein
VSAIAESSPPPHGDTGERSLPPVTQLGMISLAMIVAGGIYLSAHIPNHVPLTPAIILLAGSVLLLVTNLFLLSRVPDFPWDRFFDIAKWALLGYTIIAGMIEYAFLRNHLKGGALVVLTLSLVVFAIHVPVLIGFTVARFYNPQAEAAAGAA